MSRSPSWKRTTCNWGTPADPDAVVDPGIVECIEDRICPRLVQYSDLVMLKTSARLLRLLWLLQSRRYWSGAELSERVEVDARTVRRDIDRLRELGCRGGLTRPRWCLAAQGSRLATACAPRR